MKGDEFKANNLEELLERIKEYVDSSQASKDRIFALVYKKNLTQFGQKEIIIKLKDQQKGIFNLFSLIVQEDNNKSKVCEQILEKLRKIVPRVTLITQPFSNNNSDKYKQKADYKSYKTITELKYAIECFYQANFLYIKQNPDFSHWIDINKIEYIQKENEAKFFNSVYVLLTLKSLNKQIKVSLKEYNTKSNSYDPIKEIHSCWYNLTDKAKLIDIEYIGASNKDKAKFFVYGIIVSMLITFIINLLVKLLKQKIKNGELRISQNKNI